MNCQKKNFEHPIYLYSANIVAAKWYNALNKVVKLCFSSKLCGYFCIAESYTTAKSDCFVNKFSNRKQKLFKLRFLQKVLCIKQFQIIFFIEMRNRLITSSFYRNFHFHSFGLFSSLIRNTRLFMPWCF